MMPDFAVMHKTSQNELRLAKRMARLGTETAFEVLVKARALEAKGRANPIARGDGLPDGRRRTPRADQRPHQAHHSEFAAEPHRRNADEGGRGGYRARDRRSQHHDPDR